MAKAPERTAETPVASSGMGDDHLRIADEHIATIRKLLYRFDGDLDGEIPQVMCELSAPKGMGIKMNSRYYRLQDLDSDKVDNGFHIACLSGISPANEMDPNVYSIPLSSESDWPEALLSFKSYRNGIIFCHGQYGSQSDFCEGEVEKSADGKVSTYGIRKGEKKHCIADDVNSRNEVLEEIVSLAILLKKKLLIKTKVPKWLFGISAEAESREPPPGHSPAISVAGGSERPFEDE